MLDQEGRDQFNEWYEATCKNRGFPTTGRGRAVAHAVWRDLACGGGGDAHCRVTPSRGAMHRHAQRSARHACPSHDWLDACPARLAA